MKYSFCCATEFAAMRPAIRHRLTEISPQHAELLFVALNEAVNNACHHGCGDLVTVKLAHSAEEICLQVRHNGVGISFADRVRDLPRDELDDHGRGLAIIRRCTDSFEYDSSGRELTMRKSLKSAAR